MNHIRILSKRLKFSRRIFKVSSSLSTPRTVSDDSIALTVGSHRGEIIREEVVETTT